MAQASRLGRQLWQGWLNQPGPASTGPNPKLNLQEREAADAEDMLGTWETLSLDDQGRPVLERRDVWGNPDRSARNRGLRFDS